MDEGKSTADHRSGVGAGATLGVDTAAHRSCAVCGGEEFSVLAVRSDAMPILRCVTCGMGIVESVPDDLAQLYGDDYYGSAEAARDSTSPEHGYSDYSYTAEHGVGWAAALVQLLCPQGGRVLDVGCADGHLLAKLDARYARFGIEVNQAMGRLAEQQGVVLLGRDLLDPAISAQYAGTFDIVTAIAVFEHLRDIRLGITTALALLQPDGILLFEVPLMSAVHDNAVWLTSSLEHVWYPSEPALRDLVEAELGAKLVGTELFIAGYGSNYVGVAFPAGADTKAAESAAERVLALQGEPASGEEARARMLLSLVHAATSTKADLDAVAVLPPAALNSQLLRRLAELWKTDLWQLGLARAETQRVQAAWEQEVAYAHGLKAQLDPAAADLARDQIKLASARAEIERIGTAWEQQATLARGLRLNLDAATADLARDQAKLTSARAEIERIEAAREHAAAHASRLKSDLDVAALDRARSHIELTTVIVATEARLAAVERELAAKIEAELTLGRERAVLERRRAELAAAEGRLSHERNAVAAARERSAATERQAVARQAAVEAELAAFQTGKTWQLTALLRHGARRHPRVARLAFRTARVLWWTARGRLIEGLRFRQQVRRQLRLAATEGVHPIETATVALPAPPPQPVTEPAPDPAEIALSLAWADDPVVLCATGHRPALELGQSDPNSTEWPLVSVVITSFNYGRLIAEALDSVLNQTFRDLEVIVVEGGSSNPDSRFRVAGLQRPRTRVLMQGSRHHAGANRNYGISQARGRYICCLDADDILAPTYIEKAVYLLERHGYDVVSSAMEMFGDNQGTINIMEQPDLAALLDGNNVLVCAVYRRSLWEQAGGYRDVDRDAMGYVYEDWAFWVRLAALGARFRNLFHDPLLRYRVHGSSLSRGKDVLPMWKQRHMVRRLNQDVLQALPELIARSRKLASLRYGTPLRPPAAIDIDGPILAGQHAPTVLLAMPFLILGGGERLLSGVVAHLVRQGWRVVIITTIATGVEHGDTTPWFEQHTKEVFHLPRGFRPEMWEDFIGHLVRSRGIDVVWVVGSAVAYDCLRGLRAAHPKLRVADLLFNTVGHTDNNRRRRDLIDLIFVENREVRDWLLGRGEDGGRIRLVESGVDLAELRPVGRSAEFTRQIEAGPTDLIVGFSGRWSEEKNPLGFVEIARLVDPALPVRFVMTGTGHMRGAIEQAVQDAQFREYRFHLLGPVLEIAPVLGSFDLLVLPSILDGRPVVVLEALAMGVPVLASRVGALTELVQDGVNGWLCDPTDTAGFVARIERAARDRAGLQAMRRQARAFAEATLDAKCMLAAYEQGLTSLLPESDRRG